MDDPESPLLACHNLPGRLVDRSREDEMDAEEFIERLTPVVVQRGTPAAASAEPLLRWFRTLCTRILEEPYPDVVILEQKYNPQRELNRVSVAPTSACPPVPGR